MGRKKRTLEELTSAWTHFEYEASMLIGVAHGLMSGVAYGSVIHNALVESFVIHLRNFIEFLWPEDAKKDTVIADDFMLGKQTWHRPAIPAALAKAKIRAAQEVAHLTYSRLRLTPESKKWDFALADEVIAVFNEFARQLPVEVRNALAVDNG